jgi:hypothetical protein
MDHKKLQVQDSASRFCSKASLIVGNIIIVTTQGGMRCLIILFVLGLLSWSELMEMAVSVFLASLYSLPFWLRGHHPWVPPSSGKVNIIVQEKSISQIWLDQPAA